MDNQVDKFFSARARTGVSNTLGSTWSPCPGCPVKEKINMNEVNVAECHRETEEAGRLGAEQADARLPDVL